MPYDAFISYSHESARLATSLQDSLQRFSKPWYRRSPFVRVFRDETSFGAGHDLGDKITGALDDSSHLVLLLSPASADSPWVDDEVAYFLANKGRENITFVIEGWRGDEGRTTPGNLTGFAWDGEDVPVALRGQFEEPLAVDMRWTDDDEADLTLADERFRDDVATIAAAIRGQNKDELIGAVVAMRTRARILSGSILLGAAILLGAIAIAVPGWLTARSAEQEARDAVDEATEQLRQLDLDLADAQQNLDVAQANLDAAEANLQTVQDDLTAATAELNQAQLDRDTALAERDAAQVARDEAVLARDEAVAARDEAVVARDVAVALRDVAVREREAEEALGDALRLGSLAERLATTDLQQAQLIATESTAAARRSLDRRSSSSAELRTANPAAYAGLMTALGEKPRLVSFLQGPADRQIRQIAFTTDGRVLAATHPEGPPTFWDVATGQILAALPAGTTAPEPCSEDEGHRTSLCFGEPFGGGPPIELVSRDGRRGSSLESSGDIQLYRSPDGGDLDPLDVLRFQGNEDGGVFRGEQDGNGGISPSQAFSPDGQLLATVLGPESQETEATSGEDIVATVFLWRVTTEAPQFARPIHPATVNAVGAVSADGGTAVVSVVGGQSMLLDIETGALRAIPSPLLGVELNAIAISADGSRLATSPAAGVILVVGGDDSSTIINLPTDPSFGTNIETITFAPSGELLVADTDERHAFVVDLADPSATGLIETASQSGDSATALTIGPARPGRPHLLLAGSNRRDNVDVYDVRDPAAPENLGFILDNRGSSVAAVAVAPDGVTFATVGQRSRVVLWEVNPSTGGFTRSVTLLGHTGVTALSFDPTSRTLVVGHDDGTVRLWDIAAPVTSLGPPLPGHARALTSLTWIEGTSRLRSSDGSGVLEWDLGTDGLVAASCSISNRALTPAEASSLLRAGVTPSCG